MSEVKSKNAKGTGEKLELDWLQLEIAIDDIAEKMKRDGKTPDEIEELLVENAERVSQEMRDGEWED